jgi:hypothetical protein
MLKRVLLSLCLLTMSVAGLTITNATPASMLPPGGASERVDEVAIFRLPDGRIAEAWSLEDSLSRLLQLASSTARLRGGGSSPPPVRTLPIQEVVPGLRRGPFPTSLKRPRPHPPLPRPVLSGEAAPWRGPDHRRYGRQRGD